MRIIDQINETTLAEALLRPYVERDRASEVVLEIINEVQVHGDKALKSYAAKFDGVVLDNLIVDRSEIEDAVNAVPEELKSAIDIARHNIEKFHACQREEERQIETSPGVKCWRKSIPIEKVGIYIPGGSAPLFSTVLMLAIPARLAGCKEIILCSPPNSEGKIHPAILYCADLLGVNKILKAGGAQAIAAMSHGTESVPKVSKIFGPGNQYVTRAKELVQTTGTAIDMPAGPSEVMVVADGSANPDFVALDLLSQAEHGPDSQVVLLASSLKLARQFEEALKKHLNELPRASIAEQAIDNSVILVTSDFREIIHIIDEYAPEHLILNCAKADQIAAQITNAGSVFIGPYSAESLGDYASGTNHTLPTNGYARMYSGVSLDSFVKKITFQEVSAQGLRNIGPAVEIMAEAEALMAHKKAVTVRLQSLKN